MDYVGIFSDLIDGLAPVKIIHCRSDQTYVVQARAVDTGLLFTNHAPVPSVAADLIDLATAVYVLDWLSPRRDEKSYSLHIVVPVRNPEIFCKVEVV